MPSPTFAGIVPPCPPALQWSRQAWDVRLSHTLAGDTQVCSLMWLHTTLNHQYKHSTTLRQSLGTLWAEGGVPRFYRGAAFALVLAPATRFVDTASNAGCMALLDGAEATQVRRNVGRAPRSFVCNPLVATRSA
jgi:hypothetical protein